MILDGQQRLTSLTQVLALDVPVQTFNEKKKPIERYYYIDIEAALDDDQLDNAFRTVESDRTIKTNFGRDIVLDLSTPEKECQELHFPCNQILNSDSWEQTFFKVAPEKMELYMDFREKVLSAFRSYQLPIIALGKSTTKEAVCLVFEKVNTGGVPLSVFELVTATFAADGFNLRDDWIGSKLRKVAGRKSVLGKEPILETVEPADFLQAISLLHTYEKHQADQAAGKTGKQISAVSAKRVSVLALGLDDYQKWADQVQAGFLLAAKFLRKEGFYHTRDLPYRTQLVPLAAVLSLLDDRWLQPRIYEKLSQWYWCGVLGELYGGAVETRIANDLEELMAWIDHDADLPRTIYEASFHPSRLFTLRSRLSAAYKGLNTLVLREGAKDFFHKATVQELIDDDISLDIHHIFPRAWCDNNGIQANRYNSIINKTPISAKTNRMIGGHAPSKYLSSIQNHKQVGSDDSAMDAILETHLITPSTLRSDDFEAFYAAREASLLEIVERAMGKSLPGKDAQSDAPDADDVVEEEMEQSA